MTDNDKRSPHTVVIGGVEHTVLLTDADAERMGAVKAKARQQPQNKARASAPATK